VVEKVEGNFKIRSISVVIQSQENILQEKEHFLRIKEFEDECDRNDEMGKKLKNKQ
jgi:hypothetical protein